MGERSKGRGITANSLLTRVMHDVAKGMPSALNRGSCAWRVKPRMSSYTLNVFHNCLQAALVASLSTHDRRSRKTRAFPPRRRIYSSWPTGQRVFAQDRAMCGKSCRDAPRRGECATSLVKSRKTGLSGCRRPWLRGTSVPNRDHAHHIEPIRSRTRDDWSHTAG